MISCVVQEEIKQDQFCLLEPGTLNLRLVRSGEEAVFMSTRDLAVGEAVWLIPNDGTLIQYGVQVGVRNVGTGGPTTVTSPSQDS